MGQLDYRRPEAEQGPPWATPTSTEESSVPHDPDRSQVGLFDSEGDGHPPPEHFMPKHTVCTPVVPQHQDGSLLPDASEVEE
ncbi:hypothetical protein [Kitasatospora sp. NPDC088134]|uniref:hypothetical protein n=1 Tax=Kitasatospora sp. NPDC088134 TaxID=3364071 RepID=UPI00381C3A0A